MSAVSGLLALMYVKGLMRAHAAVLCQKDRPDASQPRAHAFRDSLGACAIVASVDLLLRWFAHLVFTFAI